jgi:alpha-tubulin suppressor-like RCC1 family protein
MSDRFLIHKPARFRGHSGTLEEGVDDCEVHMRRFHAVWVSISLLSGMLMGPVPASAQAVVAKSPAFILAAVTPTAGTITARPAKPVKGETFRVTGILPVNAGRVARLQAASGKKWKTLKSVTTDVGGRFGFATVTKAKLVTLRVVAPAKTRGRGILPEVISPSVKVRTTGQKVKPSISTKAFTNSVTTLSVKASPIRVGRRAYFDYLSGSRWVRIGSPGQSATGIASVTWRPTTPGKYAVRAWVESWNGARSVHVKTVTVKVVTAPLLVSSASLAEGTVATPYGATLAASGGVGSYKWTATGLPAGLSIAGATGKITGTPTVAAASTVTVTVSDQRAKTASKSLGLTVKAVVKLPGATKVAAGGNFTCALLSTESVSCWGSNTHGQVGDGTTSTRITPVGVAGLTAVTALAAGESHACAISSGSVYCWGRGDGGQLGNGGSLDHAAPVQVQGLTGITALVAGGDHTCALNADGGVQCWGSDTYGELGDGAPLVASTVPVPVNGLSGDVAAIAAGTSFSCALLNDKSVQCWGRNDHGQLGDATMEDHPSRVSVSALDQAIAITAGNAHACAVVSGGGVQCWGANAAGQLGDGSITQRTAPTAIPGLGGVTALAGGGQHTCALAGTVATCWGLNDNGQLGDGTNADKHQPVKVGLADGSTISAGAAHTCATAAGGALSCWGDDSAGELGNGHTGVRQLLPVRVSGIG